MKDDLLTILLPTKGRHLHTLRFLWHANEIRLPHHILVADGDVHPQVAQLIEDQTTFPNLSLEYVRYPDDVTFGHFFRKMADATQRVRTPYVKLVDNDDFVAPAGLWQCINFLEQHPDYVCCGAGIAGFDINEMSQKAVPHVTGRINRLNYRYTKYYRARDLAADSVSDRVLDAYRNYKVTFYDVARADAMRTIWQECEQISFSDLVMMEYFCALRLISFGKAHSEASSIFYLRQYGTSMSLPQRKDWTLHLAHSNFSADLSALVRRIAEVSTEPAARKSYEAELRDISAEWLREFIDQKYGMNAFTVKEALRSRLPAWFMKIYRRRSISVLQEQRAFRARLRADGAKDEYLEAFDREIAAIKVTLNGTRFQQFLRSFAPQLLQSHNDN